LYAAYRLLTCLAGFSNIREDKKMSKYEEAMKLLDEKVGNKDGLISLSTIALEPGADGKSRPAARIIVENFTADGIGENLGWVCGEKNVEMMTKLRTIFAEWYNEANKTAD